VAYDVEAVRARFPALAQGAAHFDGPGGSQTVDAVADAVAATLRAAVSNRNVVTQAERRAEQIVVDTRAAMADLLDCAPAGVVFGRSMTTLTYDVSRMLSRTWQPGDEIVVTRLDHDANIRPWVQAAERVGATVRWAPFDPKTAELSVGDVHALVNERTRLVAVTAASNLFGTIPDVAAIAAAAHGVGAVVFVDAVHRVPHTAISMADLGADLLVCSPYKFCGPHLGVLAGDVALLTSLQPDKLLPSSDAVPERFELGTLPYELLAGTTAAVDFLATLDPAARGSRRDRLVASMAALDEHEAALFSRLRDGLASTGGVTVHGDPARHTPTILFSVEGMGGAEVHAALAARGVNAPAGSFYAIEASRWAGLGDDGAVRAGLAPYTDEDDVDRLLAGVAELAATSGT
jgi:cysteine desulfurase family protein (TIGR01976 family)